MNYKDFQAPPLKFFTIAFTPLLLGLIVVAFFYKCVGNKSYFNEVVLSEQYQAVIINKYKDDKNRGAQTLTLKGFDNRTTSLIAHEWEEKFWDLCSIGDTVFKASQDSIIKLKSIKDDTLYIFRYNFNRGGSYLIRRQ